MDFEKVKRLLLKKTIRGILEVDKISHERVIDGLLQHTFSAREIDIDGDKCVIHLQLYDDNLFCKLLAGEANRFWQASMISLERSNQNQNNNASWQAIEHYYAAYFAVHYLIRVTGFSLTNIDENFTKLIKKTYIGSGNVSSITIPKGLYFLRYNDAESKVELTKKLKKDSGGSHQDAWKMWLDLVDVLKAEADVDPVEYMKTSIDLIQHKQFITRSTGQYSPSIIRSEINYQFKGGLWRFEKQASKKVSSTQSHISSKSIVISPKDDVKLLLSNNLIIISIAQEVFKHIVKSYPKSICRNIISPYS